MIYRLLGELEIGRDGQRLRLPGGPTLLLLAALLLGVNRKMPKTDLIRAAWGTERMSDTQLYKRVNEVRRLLAEIGRDDDLLNHHGFGYELRAADDEIDTLQFEGLVRQAHRAGIQDDADDEIGLLRRALGLWRGARPLSNVPSEAFHQELAQMEQRRRRAAARLFELELSRDQHELIIDELIQLTGFYPADQRLCEQLMIAQYRSGRPADVAGAYERHVEGLAEETGGVPDQLLRAFHFAVARGDLEAASLAELDIARRRNMPTHAVTYVPRQLPPAFELVGRDAAIDEVRSLLRPNPGHGPVIVISGPGGIGKTGPDRVDDSVLDTRGVGRHLLAWKLSARDEQSGLRPNGREVRAVLGSPIAQERLTGTLDASIRFTRRIHGVTKRATAEPRHPVRFALDVTDGTFETEGC